MCSSEPSLGLLLDSEQKEHVCGLRWVGHWVKIWEGCLRFRGRVSQLWIAVIFEWLVMLLHSDKDRDGWRNFKFINWLSIFTTCGTFLKIVPPPIIVFLLLYLKVCNCFGFKCVCVYVWVRVCVGLPRERILHWGFSPWSRVNIKSKFLS